MRIEVSRIWLAMLYWFVAITAIQGYKEAPLFEFVSIGLHKTICVAAAAAWLVAAFFNLAAWLLNAVRR